MHSIRRLRHWVFEMSVLCMCMLFICVSVSGAKRTLVITRDVIGPVVVDAFEAAHPDVDVVVLQVTSQAKIATLLATGVQVDVIVGDIPGTTQHWIEKDLAMDLTELVSKSSLFATWNPFIFELMTHKGRIMLLSSGSVNYYLMWYNRNMFAEVGVADPKMDWTHNDVLAMSRKIRADTNGDGEYERWGYSWNSWQGEWPFLQNEGFRWVDPTNPERQLLDSPDSISALQWMADQAVKNRLFALPSVISDARKALNDGKVAMCQNALFYKLNDSIKYEFGVAPEPTGPAGNYVMITSHGLIIPKTAKEPDLAWEFLLFQASNEMQLARLESGQLRLPVDRRLMNHMYTLAPSDVFNWWPTVQATATRPIFNATITLPGQAVTLFNQKVWNPLIKNSGSAENLVKAFMPEFIAELKAGY